MAGITVSGIGSGLDITSIVEQLVEAEISPKEERLDEKEETLEVKLSAFGAFKSALSSLQTSIEDLLDTDSFAVYTTRSSDSDIFTATASSEASPGTYKVEVLRLAQQHKLASDQFSTTDTFGGTSGDSISISMGDTTFSVSLNNAMTLEELADAINDANDNPGVTATVVRSGDGSQGLVLTSDVSGSENSLELSYGGSLSESTFGFAMSNTNADGEAIADQSELDALIKFDGYTVTSASNSIEDVIDGITLNLNGAEPGTVQTMVIEKDIDAVSEAIQSFVDAYNNARDTIASLTAYDAETETAGDLNGDSTLRMIQYQMRNILSASVESGDEDISMLWQIGIEFDSEGTLTIDTDKLESALESDFEQVADLFASDNGIATQLNAKLDVYLKADGIIDIRIDSYEGQLDDVEEDRVDLEYRTEQVYNNYMAQYTALDTLLGQLDSTSDYLTELLSSL